MTKASDVDVCENEAFLCTVTNSTRRSLESLMMHKVSQLKVPPEDAAAVEKLPSMKTHILGLMNNIEPRDNYKASWSFSWAGVIAGLIAICVAVILVVLVFAMQ